MERSHCELSTRLADRLGCLNTDCLTDVDALACCQVAAVALGANARLAFACHDRSDGYGFDARRFNSLSGSFADLAVFLDDDFSCFRIYYVQESGPSDDTVLKLFDDFLAVGEGRYFDTLDRSAVVFSYYYVM